MSGTKRKASPERLDGEDCKKFKAFLDAYVALDREQLQEAAHAVVSYPPLKSLADRDVSDGESDDSSSEGNDDGRKWCDDCQEYMDTCDCEPVWCWNCECYTYEPECVCSSDGDEDDPSDGDDDDDNVDDDENVSDSDDDDDHVSQPDGTWVTCEQSRKWCLNCQWYLDECTCEAVWCAKCGVWLHDQMCTCQDHLYHYGEY